MNLFYASIPNQGVQYSAEDLGMGADWDVP